MGDNKLVLDTNEYMLTTTDNAYNPFTQFDEWYACDVSLGYYTCAYLSRIARVSDDISPADYSLAINQAISEILKFDITGNYVRVTKDSFAEIMNSTAPHAK